MGPSSAGTDRLVTPEAVVLDYPLATVGSRAVALFLDQLILFSVFLGLVLAGTAVLGAAGPLPGWLGVTLVLLLLLTLQLGYPIVLETTWRGRTLGKAALGLRVVTASGGPIGVRHAALRALLGVVDFQLTAGAAALASALVTRQHQRLGDLAAGTVVVRERTAAEAMTSVRFEAPPSLRHYARSLDVSQVDPATYQTLRAFLRRAGTLPPEVRQRLAGDLAGRVAPRVSPPAPEGTGAEAFLLAVAEAVQARRPAAAPGLAATDPPAGARPLLASGRQPAPPPVDALEPPLPSDPRVAPAGSSDGQADGPDRGSERGPRTGGAPRPERHDGADEAGPGGFVPPA